MTRQEATAKAKELVRVLGGKPWKADVFENLGWHYAAEYPPFRVTPSMDGGYWCAVNDETRLPGCRAEYVVSESSLDPRQSVMNAIEKGTKDLHEMEDFHEYVLFEASDLGLLKDGADPAP